MRDEEKMYKFTLPNISAFCMVEDDGSVNLYVMVLEKLSQNIDLKTEEKAVVCFVHVYENNDKKISPRDYDNVETKRVLDIIALFMLRDDGPEFRDVFNTMEFGDKAKTLIYVMPEKCFDGWIYDRGKTG